jgi:amidophosphoribosyltransferase
VRVASPPIVSPCFYGIDFADEEQLAASNKTVEGIRQQIGATSLAYLSLEAVQQATQRPESEFCRACFTRSYPTRVPAGRKLAKLRFEPSHA